MKIKPEYCKVHNALSILVGKWKPIILLYLMSEGTMRYGELKKALGGITPKMLTNQLRELEEEGLINREVYREVPPKVEYSITEYGMTLKPGIYGPNFVQADGSVLKEITVVVRP